MIDKIIHGIRKIAQATRMDKQNRRAFLKGLKSTLKIPAGTTQQRWNSGKVNGGTARHPGHPNISTINPAIVNQYTTSNDKEQATPTYAANRILTQHVWSGHGIGATTAHAQVLGKYFGKARTINHVAGGSNNVSRGGYGALTPSELSAARAWFNLGAEMSDQQVQKRVWEQARQLAHTKPQPSAYGRGITNYGNNTMPT